jgi:type VI protein secretion system component VasK
MFDIKPVASQPSSNGWVWWLLGSLVAVGALAYGIWWYVTKREKQPAKKKSDERVVSPIEKATELLQNLERKELIKRGAVKEYYSELADIARMYIEEAIHIPAMEAPQQSL